jgi:PGF-CTERM protein
MVSKRPHGRIFAVLLAVVLASLLAPGVVAQQAEQSEDEPNDNPVNATLVGPGTSVSGDINSTGTNASQADADWFAFPVEAGQNVTVTLESGDDAERVFVFLASPNGSRNVTAADDTLADATIAPAGSSVTLSATVNDSRLYFVGVTGLSGEYTFSIETSGGMTMEANGTNSTDTTNTTNATATATAASTTTSTSTSTETISTPTTTTTTPTETATATSTEATTATTSNQSTTASGGTSGSGDSGGGSGGTASDQGTSTSGPGFGLLAGLVALLAAALFIARRR